MKRLDKLSYIEHRIEYLTNYVKELEKGNIKCDIDIQKERIEIYKSIKQDLEVLEIIKKKRVDIDALIRIIRINNEKSNEKMLYDYNCIVDKIYKLTMEELLKLKQWFEEELKVS